MDAPTPKQVKTVSVCALLLHHMAGRCHRPNRLKELCIGQPTVGLAGAKSSPAHIPEDLGLSDFKCTWP